MNYHDTIENFFKTSADKYICAWKENQVPSFPLMHLLKKNKEDEQFSIAIVPLSIPGGLPKGVSPLALVKPIIKEFTPDAYIVFSEAWAVDSNKLDKKIEDLNYGDMEYMKHRVERLIIIGNSISNKQHFQQFYLIKRDTRTRKKWLVFDSKDKETKLTSERLP